MSDMLKLVIFQLILGVSRMIQNWSIINMINKKSGNCHHLFILLKLMLVLTSQQDLTSVSANLMTKLGVDNVMYFKCQ